MRLSVLDQAPIRKGGTATQAIAETIELARHADRLGYHRYWLAEHHNSSSLACASPEILVAAVADRTERIRVGTGGVMLPHYSALKVAETFRMLEALHPGRIDLGLGRAPGSDLLTARALAHGAGQISIEQLPRAGARPARLPRGSPARRSSVSRGARHARRRVDPGALAARLRPRQRADRRLLRAPLLVRPLHHAARRRRDHERLPPGLPPVAVVGRSRRLRSASRWWWRTAKRKRTGSRCRASCGGSRS